MSILIAILLWIGAIHAGTYSETQFNTIVTANQGQISQISQNQELMTTIIATEDPSIIQVKRDEDF